jgi:GNAT superfamily N-acetyltransferase
VSQVGSPLSPRSERLPGRRPAGAGVVVRALPPAAQSSAAEVLARAFRDNPLNRAVIGDAPARRLRANRHGMRALMVSAESWGALLLSAWPATPGVGAPSGVLMAVSPFDQPLPAPPLAWQLRCLLGQGWRTARRWASVHRELERVHPLEPHWYLSLLGVDPPHQGRGAGRALLRSFLRRVDAEAAPGYLETDRAENLPLYEREGFEVAGELSVLGARVWRMWRTPRRLDAARAVDSPVR